MDRQVRWRPLLLLATAIAVASCAPTVVIGTSTTSGAVSTSTTSTHEFALSDLVGNWDNGKLFLQFTEDGSYQVLQTPGSDPNDPVMGGFVARDGINLIFVTNIYGECSGETGVYEPLMASGQLVLSLVDDPCQFRSERFVDPWERAD